MKNYIYTLLLALFTFSACNDDFLDRKPISTQTVASLKTYDNFKTYAWGIYSSCFHGGAYTDALDTKGVLNYPDSKPYDTNGDDAMFAGGTGLSNPSWAWQTVTKNTGNGSWSFSFIRQVNIMLDAIDNSDMGQAEKDHWRAVGYFFRAFRYSQLVAMYGDVPWLEHEVKTTDNDIIYGPRTPRDEVATNILSNLQWAEQHIKPDGEGAGTNSITVHVVRALISRFGLAEGTWRKYHQLSDANKYLDASIAASTQLMASFPSISSEYDALYNSESLANTPGIILYRAYLEGQMTHNFSRYERTNSSNVEMSKEGVSSYLTRNGLPVRNAQNQSANNGADGKYCGDDNMYNEFRNRDYRLYYTVAPPFRLNVALNATTQVSPAAYLTTKDTYGAAAKPVTAADSSMFVEYIKLMQSITSTKRTTGYQYPAGVTYTSLLPLRNWEGNALLAVPHINQYQEGRGFIITRGGYYLYKYYNTSVNPNGQVSTNDLPIFRMGEVLVNYAEAMWERGQFTQAIADQTINKLRARAGVANMVVANIDASFDPDRDMGGYSDPSDPSGIADYAVDPVLWEIRRERRVELMGDGFRFNDLKRWRKGHYLNKMQLGVQVDNRDYSNALAIYPYDQRTSSKSTASNNQIGPIALFGDPVADGKGWKWYYYLYPVPPTQIALNPKLTQNPGWDND